MVDSDSGEEADKERGVLTRSGGPTKMFSSEPEDLESRVNWFFFIVLVAHFFDYFFVDLLFRQGSFPVSPFGTSGILFMYAFITLYGYLTLNEFFSLRTLVITSLMAFVLPRILIFATNTLTNAFASETVMGLLLLFPVWVVYLMNKAPTNMISSLRKWYYFIIGIILTFYLITQVSIPTQYIQEGGDRASGVAFAKRLFVSMPFEIVGNIWEKLKSIPSGFQKKLNDSLSTKYFTGRVERNKDSPLGVYIEDLRTAETTLYEGDPVYIWANMRGKSFEGGIDVQNRCYADGGDIGGIVMPSTLSLYYDESVPLECVFNAGLPAGSNEVILLSGFDFSTWGYITYVFVDSETSRSFYSQQKSIHSELDIPKKADVIYTSGPASIGVNLADLPVIVYSDKRLSLSRLGITVGNLWPQGSVDHLKSLKVHVPEPLKLSDCSWDFVGHPTQPQLDEDVRTYTFKLEDPKRLFTTVACDLKLDGTIADFFGINLKTTKTFAIEADYYYLLEKKLIVRVKER